MVFNTELPVRILTHNIRYATSTLFDNERPWAERAPLIASELLHQTRFLAGELGSQELQSVGNTSAQPSSFISLQEVLHDQLHDILQALNGIEHSAVPQSIPNGPYWAHIGVARDDGKQKGEYSPILYPVKLFKLLHFENRWLSPTPNKPSKGWDAGSKRILTTGVFEHKATGQRFAVFNTHLDNAGAKAREESVAIILDVIERVCEEGSVDVQGSGTATTTPRVPLNFVLAGDFNSFPTQEAYKALIASD